MTADPSSPSILMAFSSHISAAGYNPNTVKGLMSGLRRIVRDLDADDMQSASLLACYRDQLRPGTRNIFDLVWSNLQEMLAPDIVLSKGGLPPKQSLVHPLYASMTLLSIIAPDHDRLAELHWRDLMSSPHGTNPTVVGAARRVWDHQTALLIDGTYSAPEPRQDDTLVPAANDRRPMRGWFIRYIVNSRSRAGDRPAIALVADLEERLTALGISGTVLRAVHEPFEAQRERLLRSTTVHAGLQKALEAANRGDLGAALHMLEHWVPLGR